MDFELLKGMWPVLAVLAVAALILWRLEVRERRKIRQREDMRRVLEAGLYKQALDEMDTLEPKRPQYPPPPRPAPPPPPRSMARLRAQDPAPVDSLRKRDTAPVDSARTPEPFPMPIYADDWLVAPVSVSPSECTPEPEAKFTGYSGGDTGGGGASDSWSGGDSSGPTDAGGGGCASDNSGGGCGSE